MTDYGSPGLRDFRTSGLPDFRTLKAIGSLWGCCHSLPSDVISCAKDGLPVSVTAAVVSAVRAVSLWGPAGGSGGNRVTDSGSPELRQSQTLSLPLSGGAVRAVALPETETEDGGRGGLLAATKFTDCGSPGLRDFRTADARESVGPILRSCRLWPAAPPVGIVTEAHIASHLVRINKVQDFGSSKLPHSGLLGRKQQPLRLERRPVRSCYTATGLADDRIFQTAVVPRVLVHDSNDEENIAGDYRLA